MSTLSFRRYRPSQQRPVSLDILKTSQPETGSPAWMLARLRRTLVLGVCLLAANLVASLQAVPMRTLSAQSEQVASTTVVDHEQIRQDQPRAVLPVGWRRTAQGWEYVSSWQPPPEHRLTLNQHILAQQQSESQWLQRLMASVRSIPPTRFAMLQLLGVGMVAVLAYRNRDIVELVSRPSN